MDNAWIGIDPGAKGYICLLVPDQNKIGYMSNMASPMEIADWLKTAKHEFNIKIVMLEQVRSIFGTSAKSNFSFGYNVGKVSGIVEASGLGVDLVLPKLWQKEIGVRVKGNLVKKEVATIAKRIYPHAEIHGPKGGLDDGKSDYLMIAHYAYLKYR